MNAQTVGWLVFLAILKNFSCGQPTLFTLDGAHPKATEGSCIEIKCRVTSRVNAVGAYWFWIKDGQWDETDKTLTGTVIYSTNIIKRPVSADFADRVNYTGSPSLSWNGYFATSQTCSILICDLKKTDNGNYSFRFLGKQRWRTKPVRLEVEENPCPITFEKPPVVNESDTVTLTCSTLSSCPSNPKIGGLTQLPPTPPSAPQQDNGSQKSTTVSFTVNWQDDGKEFSCQADDTDKYLIRNISLTVEYAPKDTSAKINPENVMEKQPVTLTCSAKGRPEPSFTWFKNKKEIITGAVWKITSISESENGEYHCVAKNKQGAIQSNPVIINVKYVPEVEVKSSASIVRQGNTMTLTCNVKRSNPQPHTYDWFKDEKAVFQQHTQWYVVERIEPENRGFYTCRATNTVGTGTSAAFQIEVEYGPRNTIISISKNDNSVGVGKSLTFHCITEANPAPNRYSWYRYNDNNKQIDWKFQTTTKRELRLNTVKRTDDACYMCNATNSINTGDNSEPLCIQVLYGPTELTLSMDTELREGQLVTIKCTVESLPLSTLTLKWTSESNPQSSLLRVTHPIDWPPNTLQHAFNVTSTHTGLYTCDATNSEGSKTSEQRTLVVEYRPKDVTVKAQPGLVVVENESLALDCIARSFPPVTSVTWMKMTDGKSKILQKTKTFILNSVRPSDSGLYSCEARNDIGTGNSKQTEVKVKYGPKHTTITTVAEHQLPDGTSSVTLSCSSQSYPRATQYSWYKMKERKEKVSDHQNYTVYSDQPGDYYCIAKNEISQRSSEPVRLFDRNVMRILFIVFFFIILLIIVLIVVVYRHKRKKLEQQGATNTLPCFGFLGWWNGAGRRNRMSDPGMGEPFRSRNDLLADQPYRPNAQRRQPRPDNTPASNINSVYCTVNLPSGQQGRPPQKIIRQQGGHTQDDSVNYASLHFENQQKNKLLHPGKVEEDVYAKVSKQKPPKKNEERPEDYENASAARAPNPISYDTDTSEDEVQINYSQVSFEAKPGHQRVVRDSSSSDDDETQYSEVKV